MKKSETLVQFSCETTGEYWKNEYKRSKGKLFAYLYNRYQWKKYPLRKVPPFPLNIDIEVSSKCQLKCTHCFRQYMDIGENDFMSMSMYKNIITECGRHKLFTLKFSMRGEPLMHPNIVEMVVLAKQAGIKEVWINTNGGMITEKLACEIIKAGTDWITVSFDGLNKTYESIRIPLQFKDSLKKLKILRKARDKLKADTLLNVQTLWSAIKDNPDEYISLMKKIVDRVAYNPDMNFEKIIMVPDKEYRCPRLWQRMCITSNGNYLKCPSDFKMQEILGNVNNTPIKTAWDTFQEKQRQMHLSGKRLESKVCKQCHHGATKHQTTVTLQDSQHKDYTYDYNECFTGWGKRNQTEKNRQ